MKSAIERSNALYKALEDFIQDGDGLFVPRDIVHEEIDNFLDDIEKRRERFEYDILILDKEIANLVCDNIFLEYQRMLKNPNAGAQVYIDCLLENDKFQDGVQMIRGAIVEEFRK